MIFADAVGVNEVPSKRPKIDMWAKQKLIEELLELPYSGKDLRNNAFGADTNYLE